MRFLPLLLTLVMLAVLLVLGLWQLDRLAWKQDLLAQISERRLQAPRQIATAAGLARLTRSADEFSPVYLSGRWHVELEQYWFAQAHLPPPGLAREDQIGFHVLTPLELEDGSFVFVDRGFVPARLRDASSRPVNLPTQITGILRWPDRRGRFDAADRPDLRQWYVRDTVAMAQAAGISAPPFLIEQSIPQNGWPYAGQSRLSLSNRHLEYAMTWFGLALVLVIISTLWHIHRLRSKQSAIAALK